MKGVELMIKNNLVKITYQNGKTETFSRILLQGALTAWKNEITEYCFLSNPTMIYKILK